MINPKDVTIIIPHLGATKEQCYALDECLTSLRENSPEIRVLVAKNGGTACQCKRDIRVLEQGQCKAVNAAVAITNTRWIFISNDDMIYPPNWWEDFTGCFDKVPACMSPQLVEPRPGAPTFIVKFCGGAGGDFDKKTFYEFVKEKPGDRVLRTGFNFPVLIKRDLWDMVGGYDINYDPWGSNGDSDLQYKIMLAGVQPYQNMNCWVYHFSQTSGTFEPRNDSHRFRNYGYFKEKWGFDRTDNGIWEADFDIPQPQIRIGEGRIFRPAWEGAYVG